MKSSHRRPRRPATVTHISAAQHEYRRRRRAARRPSPEQREVNGEARLVVLVLAVTALWVAVAANWARAMGFLGL